MGYPARTQASRLRTAICIHRGAFSQSPHTLCRPYYSTTRNFFSDALRLVPATQSEIFALGAADPVLL